MARLVSGAIFLFGAVLVGLAAYNIHLLLAAPLEMQRGYLARTLFPAVGGLWLVIGGLRGLTR